ncbi:hypothetical protein AB0C06_30225 [Micromonospora inaquosa]|uniref:hypothetical protein n=1 Tax=Micromonospora inaquosa TaxID=2203716 RepID=UPI0033E0E8B4
MQKDEQFDLDEILARVASDTLKTLRATTDIERRLQEVTSVPPRPGRRIHVSRRCGGPAL